MPYKSRSQQRKFYAMVSKGEISKSKADEWSRKTPNIKGLPDKKKKSAREKYAQFIKN